MFNHLPYLTDNPFRLLGVGSLTPLAELRQKSRSLEKQLAVGFAPAVALEDVFGREELSHCASLVQALTTDPKRLVLYRMYWPLFYTPPLDPVSVHTELSGWQAQRDPSEFAQFVQGRFLVEWIRFLGFPDEFQLATALDSLHPFEQDEEFADRLEKGLLTDELGLHNVSEFVQHARAEIYSIVLLTGLQVAADAWEDSPDFAIKLITVLVECTALQDHVHTALSRVFQPIGDTLLSEVKALEHPRNCDYRVTPVQEPTAVCSLRKLADALAPHLSQAHVWRNACNHHLTWVAHEVCELAQVLAHSDGRYTQALVLLKRARTLALPPEWLEQIRGDLDGINATLGTFRSETPPTEDLRVEAKFESLPPEADPQVRWTNTLMRMRAAFEEKKRRIDHLEAQIGVIKPELDGVSAWLCSEAEELAQSGAVIDRMREDPEQSGDQNVTFRSVIAEHNRRIDRLEREQERFSAMEAREAQIYVELKELGTTHNEIVRRHNDLLKQGFAGEARPCKKPLGSTNPNQGRKEFPFPRFSI